MAETASMPKSIQSDISVDAVGEALLQHYNVGITNPWYEAGFSEQETYNRRMLPWSGNNYSVDTTEGTVSGPNASSIPEDLKNVWVQMANAANNYLEDEDFDNLEDLYDTLVNDVGESINEV